MVQNKSFNIIFAVTQSNAQIYKLLANSITGASTGTLNEDSSNIIALVEDEYRVKHKTIHIFVSFGYFNFVNISTESEINC